MLVLTLFLFKTHTVHTLLQCIESRERLCPHRGASFHGLQAALRHAEVSSFMDESSVYLPYDQDPSHRNRRGDVGGAGPAPLSVLFIGGGRDISPNLQ